MTRSDLAAILLLTVAVSAFFGPALFGDRAVFTWNMDRWLPWAASATAEDLARPTRLADCARQFAVMRDVATDAFREGRIPLWNRHLYAGTPFLANFQPGVFYPPNLALAASGMDVPDQMTWYATAHLWLGALGMFVLLRMFSVRGLAALVAAVVFAWSAPNASRTGLPTLMATIGWLPWALAACVRWFERRDALGWAGMAIALGLAGLAGFAQLFVFTAYAWAGFGLIVGLGRTPERRRSGWVGWAIAGLLGLALVAVHLVPTLEFSAIAQDATNTPAMLASGTLHPWTLAKFVVPDLLGNPLDENSATHLLRVGDGYYFQTEWTTAIYVGLLPWILGAIAVFAPGDRRRVTLFAIALTGLGLALCLRTPLTALLTALPGLAFSRPDRATILVSTGLAVLAGIGADRLASSEGPGWRRPANLGGGTIALSLLALTVLLGVAGPSLLPGPIATALGDEAIRRAIWPSLAVLTVAFALLAARISRRMSGTVFLVSALTLIGFDVGRVALAYNVMHPKASIFRAPRPGSALAFLQERQRADAPFRIVRYEPQRSQFTGVLPPSTASWYDLDDVLGFDSINTSRYQELLAALDPDIIIKRGNFRGPRSPDRFTSPILDLLNVRYVLAPRGSQIPGLARVHESDLAVFENTNAHPRAYLVGDVRPGLEPRDLARASFSENLWAGAEVSLPKGGSGIPGDARITEYADERVRVEIAPGGPSLLVLADAHFPGWQAFVDGAERPIHRVNWALRGVAVEADDHEVVFEYRPRSFRTGAAISLAALLAILGGAFFVERRKGNLA